MTMPGTLSTSMTMPVIAEHTYDDAWHMTLERWRLEEDQEFKVIFNYIVNLRPAWVILSH